MSKITTINQLQIINDATPQGGFQISLKNNHLSVSKAMWNYREPYYEESINLSDINVQLIINQLNQSGVLGWLSNYHGAALGGSNFSFELKYNQDDTKTVTGSFDGFPPNLNEILKVLNEFISFNL